MAPTGKVRSRIKLGSAVLAGSVDRAVTGIAEDSFARQRALSKIKRDALWTVLRPNHRPGLHRDPSINFGCQQVAVAPPLHGCRA